MNEKKYCPDCGFEFTQGDGNADYCYENGVTYYACPNCGWEGTSNDLVDENGHTDDWDEDDEIGELD